MNPTVVQLSTFHESCGIATYTEALSNELRSLERRVIILAPTTEPGARTWGPQPKRLWQRDSATLWQAWRTFRAIRKERPAAVHIQFNMALYSPRFLLALCSLCHAAKIPVAATLHARFGSDRKRNAQLGKQLGAMRRAHWVVHNVAHRTELSWADASVIPHGVPTPQPGDLAAAKRALGIDPSDRTIAHLGFLHPHKGVAETIDAVGALHQRGMTDLHFIVCGAVPSDDAGGRFFASLQQRARDLGIASHVHMDGRFAADEDVLARLHAADWIVLNYLSSADQGTSGAARHALASGRPLAVSSAPIFDDLRPAVHTMSDDLSNAIASLFDIPTAAAATLERSATFCAANSWRQIAHRHRDLYEQLGVRWAKTLLGQGRG